ncbi:TonB-dependent receptor [Dyella flagellata]
MQAGLNFRAGRKDVLPCLYGKGSALPRTALWIALGISLWMPFEAVLAQTSQATDNKPETSQAPATGKKKTADGKAKPTELSVVTVTGILGSIDRTIDAKRYETAVVDTISAEDVGKFPDTNLADSLQHVTSVEITRDNNGEGQYVTVRGLPTDFTLATFNGLSATSVDLGVRTFDYNLVSPDFVSTLKVYKTSRADLDEGGIGANVDMETITPFGIGKERTVITAKGQGSPGEADTRYYPDLTGLFSDVFDDGKFGATIGFDWNKRAFLNQSSDPSPFYGVTINGKGPYYAYSETGYSNMESKVDTRTVYTALQWRPLKSTTATLTGFYAHRDSFYVTADNGVVPLEPFGAPSYNGPGADYSVDQNGVFNRLSVPVVAYTFYNTYSDDRATMKNLRLNVDTNVGNWEFSETAQYSKSSDTLEWMRPLLINSSVGGQTPTPNTPVYGGYQIYPGAPIQGYILDPSFNISDPSQWADQQFKNVTETGNDTIKSLQLDVTRYFDDGILESVKFGAKAYDRPRVYDYHYWTFAFQPGQTTYPFASAVQYPSWATSVLNGYGGPGARPSGLFFINPNLWLNQYFGGSLSNFRSNPQTVYYSNPGNNWNMIERGRDAYVMANFKFDGKVPISGNIGLRYVNTFEEFLYDSYNIADITFPPCHIGTAGCEGAIFPPISRQDTRGASHVLLPSLNAAANLTDNMVLRLGASKTISLPTIDSMVPVPAISVDSFQIAEGNANLKPFSSINYDLSWEWYFRPSSVLSVAGYDKQIHGFIQQGSTTQNIGGYTFHVTYPVNASNGFVRGLEADYKQSLDFLPSFWSGFGFEINGTFSDGQTDAAPQYNVVRTQFPGLSKKIFNATLFYEKYGFSGMMTLNHRGRYVFDPNVWGYNTTEQVANGRNQVDMHLQYGFTPNLTVFADCKNLFNTPIVYSEKLRNGPSTEYPGEWLLNGRTVMLGATLKF